MKRENVLSYRLRITAIAVISFAFIVSSAFFMLNVYAADDAGDQNVQTEQTDQSGQTEQKEPEVLPTPPEKVKITKQITGYEAVLLAWKPVKSSEGTVYYEVRQGKKVVKYEKKKNKKEHYQTSKCTKANATGLTTTSIRIPLTKDADGKLPDTAKYSVYAYIVKPDANGNDKKWYSDPAKTKKIRIIHPMYVSFTAKKGAKYYTTKTTKKVAGTLKAGKTYYAYGGTRVKSEYDATLMILLNGKTYYVKPSSAKNFKQKYSFKKPFTDAEVESYINDSGLNSNPKKVGNRPRRLIWVNTYNQRLYLFKGSKGKWKIEKKLAANTGGANLPTPYGYHRISTKWDKKKTTGTRWWCIFNGVGIHQKLRQPLGIPGSGGCVRIPTSEAKWFYYNISKRTTVYVY